MPILLKDATFIDWKSLTFKRTNILAEEGPEGKISFHTDMNSIPSHQTRIIDCAGRYVTKSFAVGHHHVYSALARGMGAPAKNPENFREILQYVWWTLDTSLDADMIEASALVTAMAAAKAGSTFVIDHHASPNHINGSLEIIAKAFERVGVSHLLCYEISDRDGVEKAQQGIEETENLLSAGQGLIGLHASFTVGNQTMQKAAGLMEKYNSGVHIHVAEDEYDQQHSKQEYSMRVVDRLNDFGFLESPKSILVHCLHLDQKERDRISNSNAWVVENIESNMNNNVGFFDGRGLGDRIFLGTDGMHSDMLRSAQAAFFAGRRYDNIDFNSAYQRFRNVHHYLSQNNFNGDGDNNLVVLDYDSPTEFNEDNFHGHFIFGLGQAHIRDVISNGNLIVHDRQLQMIDEKEILEFARKQSMRLWDRMKG